jgi:hypothetical protein
MENELKPYAWLIEAIKPHCDQVISHTADWGDSIGIGAQWGGPKAKIRRAVLVQSDHCNINQEIELGLTTRRSVINSILSHTPML